MLNKFGLEIAFSLREWLGNAILETKKSHNHKAMSQSAMKRNIMTELGICEE